MSIFYGVIIPRLETSRHPSKVRSQKWYSRDSSVLDASQRSEVKMERLDSTERRRVLRLEFGAENT